MNNWTHRSLYNALVSAGLGNSTDSKGSPKKDPYVKLFEHKPNCAVLYPPDSTSYSKSPLHLNKKKKSWQSDFWEKIKSAIPTHPESIDSNGFERYTVSSADWDVIADAVKYMGVDLGAD